MAAIEVQTPFGHPIPPAPGHSPEYSVTTHIPAWETVAQFSAKDPKLFGRLTNLYPRFKPNQAVAALAVHIMKASRLEGKGCMLFTSHEAAIACQEFATSDRLGDDACSPSDVTIRCFKLKECIFATFFPIQKFMFMIPYWQHAGAIISPRQAVANMPMVDQITEVAPQPTELASASNPIFNQIRTRIASLLERQVVPSPSRKPVQPSDVYVFQTGMASLFYLLRWLPHSKPGSLVCWGFAFQSTLQLFSSFGHHVYKHFIAGNELDALESYAAAEIAAGRPIQALFTEFPNNPLLVSTDLVRLRQIATKYDFLLVVDDTLGSFANIDVLGPQGADVLWSSLTKSFGGYADLMAGSVVLNPSSVYFNKLKELFNARYHNDLYIDDALVLEYNSRDYLARSVVLNSNALAIANYLDRQCQDPASTGRERVSTIAKVFHPSVRGDGTNYASRMRAPDEEFVPGYGCLLSVEFTTQEALVAWYNVIGKYVHVGPHLGAHRTLIMPYTQGLYGKPEDLAKVAGAGLNVRQVRISAGLEDIESLLAAFRLAQEAADATVIAVPQQ